MTTNNQATTLPQDTTNNDFMTKIQNQLLGQSGIISSSNTNLEDKLASAISGIKSSADSSNKVVQSQFEREAQGILETGNDAQLAGRAAGQGGIMNMAALRELTGTTDKNLKDLAQRKQELILQNNSQAASKVAEMEMAALKFKQEAEQQVFSNLLGMGNYANQVQSEQRLAKAQSFTEQQAVSSVALQYGLSVKPGDTLESIVSKAAPMASKEQQMKLAKMQSEINRSNAEIRKINAEGAGSSNDIDIIAQAAFLNPAVLSTVKDPTQLSKVINKVNVLKNQSIYSQIDSQIASGTYKTKEQALKDIQISINTGTMDTLGAQNAINYINQKPNTSFVGIQKKSSSIPKQTQSYTYDKSGLPVFNK